MTAYINKQMHFLYYVQLETSRERKLKNNKKQQLVS